MTTVQTSEKRARFEVETDAHGSLCRLYEDEQENPPQEGPDGQQRPGGYSYTTYEARIALPDGAPDSAPDLWAQQIKDADRQAAASAARKERDRLLLACDWAVLPDAQTERAAWENYRQALRDVPEQAGFPYTIEWPEKPKQ